MDARVLHGTAAAPGIAYGTIAHQKRQAPAEPSQVSHADSEREVAAFSDAIQCVREEIHRDRGFAVQSAGVEAATIFDAHELILDDPSFTGEITQRIQDNHVGAIAATNTVAEEIAAVFASLDDEYLRERAADVRDVAAQLVAVLRGDASPTITLPERAILVAEELFPSDTGRLDLSKVAAFVTERGSRTAHIAILSRAMNIPLVVGVADAQAAMAAGTPAIVNGDTGEIVVNPAESDVLHAQRAEHLQQKMRIQRLQSASIPATTADGSRITLLANIGTLAEARAARAHGAEGIGLFRTEFLYGGRETPPDEDEQVAVYRAVAEMFAPHPVIIRTLDAGGDKPIPGVDIPGLASEMNPFLGLRGLRLSLALPDVFATQLRALLRAATIGNIHVMFPMVTDLADVQQARAILADAANTLKNGGIPHAPHLPVGMMIEVPAAAIAADLFAPHVDFFSIGTNDLAQYTLAADRTNAEIAARYSSLHPAILRLIRGVVRASTEYGKGVAVCGEMAGDPNMIPVLVGLGIRELSMVATAIPTAKDAIRTLRVQDAEIVAAEVEAGTGQVAGIRSWSEFT